MQMSVAITSVCHEPYRRCLTRWSVYANYAGSCAGRANVYSEKLDVHWLMTFRDDSNLAKKV